MWSLYKDPNGENVFEQQSFRSSSALQSQMHRQDSEKIVSLQREVGTLKKILRENSVSLDEPGRREREREREREALLVGIEIIVFNMKYEMDNFKIIKMCMYRFD